MNISYIVACFNDQLLMVKTVKSILKQVISGDEIIVVDSSSNQELTEHLSVDFYDFEGFSYIHIPPSGIYPALNFGIKQAKNTWVQIINSADYLLDDGRIAASAAIKKYGEDNEVIVFSQMYTINDKKVLIYRPQSQSIWPHQSILIKKTVHDNFGLYDEQYSYAADQIFLFEIRSKINFVMIDFVLTSYDITGVSSRFSLKQCSELKILSKLRGMSFIHSYINAYLFPMLSALLNILIGRALALRLKFWIRGMSLD